MEDGETHFWTDEVFLPYEGVLRELSEERKIETDREQFYVEDVRVPESPEHMRSILKRIRKGVDEGRLVYVHCLGGHGRTGTAAGCWLLDRGIAADGEEALEIIRKARLHEERLRNRTSPETGEQRDFVGEWAIWE
jgi:protein-tyrosine phosphatase